MGIPVKTVQKIRAFVEEQPLGRPFTSRELIPLGSRAAVDQALSRLAKEGLIVQVARGVFVRPEISRYVGPVMPEPMAVAEAIARSMGAVVEVHGAEAARRFELTTQVPAQPVFYTTGSARRFHIDRLEIRLEHISPRKLTLAGRPAGLALIALWYLGKNGVTSEHVEKIRRQLPASEFEVLKSATGVMPVWMIQALKAQAEAEKHVPVLSAAA